MGLKGSAYIVGDYEHPTRHAIDKSLGQLHAEVALGALDDAGLTLKDADGYFYVGVQSGWESAGAGPTVSPSPC